MIKSGPVASSKELKRVAFLNIAELLRTACGCPFHTAKRFPTTLMGEFCTKDDQVVTKEFLPMLADYLKESQGHAVDHMVALAALEHLGHADIIPILMPHIRGSQSESDPAQRTRAVLALRHVMHSNPERVNKTKKHFTCSLPILN